MRLPKSTTKLKQYFPMIREREDIKQEIRENPKLLEKYREWDEEQQEEFLDYCTGVKGVKILYDAFFKEIMNPENTPERLNELLSLLLGQSVTIKRVLPGDSTRLADEQSLLIMDILVELADTSLANVEVQKIGYRFPGQRSACYSSDLLLRQYKRVKGEKKKAFSYKDIKSVYTIVFFETSIKEFHEYPQNYIHKFKQQSDTGLELELLQKYVFIPLDIFRGIYHNDGKSNGKNSANRCWNKTEAWLTFLSTDEPEIIIELISQYPEFKEMYEEIYVMCQNVEKVMEMFSKELIQLDRNTVQYMIDEMQDTIDVQKEELEAKQETIDTQKGELEQQKATISTQKNELEEQKTTINTQKEELEAKQNTIDTQKDEIETMKRQLQSVMAQIEQLKKQ
uniref:PD-(D/E)XK nuclease family transposase n=1 Tax=Lachnospira sp. TaxID=2049031 RepID=UPI004026A97F